MREIKFRAWDGEKMFYFTFEDIWGGGIYIGRDNSYRADITHKSIIKMQYTGRKDKNGKEICSDDFVFSIYHDRNLRVFWECGAFKLIDIHSDGDCKLKWAEYLGMWNDQCEVIGNIYENPELLEGKR